jgi:NitT/TauT family transport system ATP-binding protein
MTSDTILATKFAVPGSGERNAGALHAAARDRARSDSGAGQPLLDVRGVTIQYKTQAHLITATYRVSFKVLQGDRFVVVGPSGCGKSTLLKAVGGYLAPTEGEIRLKGELITRPGPDRIMVFQEFDQLLPWMTVLENVMFPLKTTGTLRGKAAIDRAMHYIEKVKLADFANSYPHTLSGGMKQRVAIARGMAMEPDILLMDEPFAALDALTRTRMQDELLSLWDDTRFTVLFVTHSIPEAIKLGSRILLLSPHPGQVKAEINSVPRGQENSNEAAALGRDIHDMLFADQIEEAPNAANAVAIGH